jgi:AcrR family transcriptional regulator
VSPQPSTDRGRRTVDRIVTAAGDLFYRSGVAATGLNDIATQSGTGKGQLYHFFAGKTELVRAVIDRQATRTIDAQRSRLEAMSTADDLRAWATEAVVVHGGSEPARCPLGALVHDVAADDSLRPDLDAGFDRWRELLASGLARLQSSGAARTDRSPQDQADLLLIAYEGGLVLAAARATTAPLRLALDAAVRAILTD